MGLFEPSLALIHRTSLCTCLLARSGAGRCSSWGGGGGAGPALGRPRRCVCGVLGLALFDALLVSKVGGPSHIHVGLRCWLQCWLRGWVRCRAGRMIRCRAGRRIRGRDLLPLVSIGEIGPRAAFAFALLVVPVPWLQRAVRCSIIRTTRSSALHHRSRGPLGVHGAGSRHAVGAPVG